MTGKFRRDKPKNVAAITHDYTIHRDDGTKDTRVEKFFSQLDGAAAAIAAHPDPHALQGRHSVASERYFLRSPS